MERRLIFIPILLVLVAVTLAGACGGDDSLTIYSGRSSSLVEPLLEEFTEETGIDIKVRYGDSAELAATILEEGDNSPADVFFSQDAGALGALAAEGRLQVLGDSLLALVPAEFRSPEGLWVGVSGRVRVVVFSTENTTADQLPASVSGLVLPEWNGRVGWAPTNGSFQAFVTGMRVILGDDFTREWLEAMKENGARDYPNNTSIVQAVADGEIDVGLVNHYYLYRFLAEQGSGFKARNHFLAGGDVGALVNIAGAAVIKETDRAEDAERFISYLLSETAQTFFAEETFEYPLTQEVAAFDDLPALSSLEPPAIDLTQLDDLQGTLDLLRDTGVLP